MSPFNLAVTVLLGIGVACEVICAVGVLVMRGPFQKLHYASAGTTVGAFCIGAAIVARETLHGGGAVEVSAGGLETLAAVAFMFLLGPAVTILTARAARRLEHEPREITPGELERGA
jgi:multisubunit Na+/H+ antiporter MnhG subunit